MTFKALQEASFAVQSASVYDPRVLEAVTRLAELVGLHADELGSFRGLFSSLARSTSLWNYIDTDNVNIDDAFVAKVVTAPELGEITFHRERINALNTLLAGWPELSPDRTDQLWHEPLGWSFAGYRSV